MNTINVNYVTEEEKLESFRKAMEIERHSSRARHTTGDIYKLVALAVVGAICAFIGGELIIGTILCGFCGLLVLAK